MRSATLGKSSFFSTLIIGLNDDGLFLGVCFPFNFGSNDLLIPINDFSTALKYDTITNKISGINLI